MDELSVRIAQYFPVLLQGVKATLIVTAGSLLLSTVLGLIWALMRSSGIRWLAWLSESAVNIIRGIPIIVILFYVYFVFPDIGIDVNAVQASILGLGVAYSAYQSENFRAGIEAIDHGQVEASQSMGMTWATMMRRVILAAGGAHYIAAVWQHHDHDAQGFVSGVNHYRGGAGHAGQAAGNIKF